MHHVQLDLPDLYPKRRRVWLYQRWPLHRLFSTKPISESITKSFSLAESKRLFIDDQHQCLSAAVHF